MDTGTGLQTPVRGFDPHSAFCYSNNVRRVPGAARIIAHMVAIMSHVGVIMSQLISGATGKI